jgi:hypothetical protein
MVNLSSAKSVKGSVNQNAETMFYLERVFPGNGRLLDTATIGYVPVVIISHKNIGNKRMSHSKSSKQKRTLN